MIEYVLSGHNQVKKLTFVQPCTVLPFLFSWLGSVSNHRDLPVPSKVSLQREKK